LTVPHVLEGHVPWAIRLNRDMWWSESRLVAVLVKNPDLDLDVSPEAWVSLSLHLKNLDVGLLRSVLVENSRILEF
jgi:hypothetical protein